MHGNQVEGMHTLDACTPWTAAVTFMPHHILPGSQMQHMHTARLCELRKKHLRCVSQHSKRVCQEQPKGK